MDAIVAGHICIDLTPGLREHEPPGAIEALVRPGALVDARGLTVSPGGAVANTGVGLARMGHAVRLIARVGADPLAGMLRSRLEEMSAGAVRHNLIEDHRRGTSFTVVLAVPGLDRVFLHDTGANDSFSVSDIAEAIDQAPTERPRLFHFGYPPAIAAMYRDGAGPLGDVMRRARAAGMTTSLDFSLPDPDGEAARADWHAILADALPAVDICFPSVEELSLMLDPDGYRRRKAAGAGGAAAVFDVDYAYQLAGRCIALGAAIVVVKLGQRGMLARWAGGRRTADTGALALGARLASGPGGTAAEADAAIVPAFAAAEVVSATGAGDTAIAGTLSALLHGESLLPACAIGCVAGRNAVTTVDSISSVRRFAELVDQRSAAGARAKFSPNGPAWHRGGEGLWIHHGGQRNGGE